MVRKRHSQLGGVVKTTALFEKAHEGIAEDEEIDYKEAARVTLRELLVYLGFLMVTCILAFGMISPNFYYYTKGLEDLFVNSEFSSEGTDITYNDITSMENVWDWMDKPMLEGLFPTQYYNGDALPSSELGKNVLVDSKLLGVPRLRQVKVKEGSCDIPDAFDDIIYQCYGKYSTSNEDTALAIPAHPGKLGCTGSYADGTKCDNTTASAWRYQSEGELDSSWYWGKFATYGGGGYAQLLSRNYTDSQTIVSTLKQQRWFDRGSRALFVDYSVYNGNVNLFNIGRFVLEFPATGGVLPTFRLLTLKFIRYVTTFDYFILACEIIFMLFIVYYTVEEVIEFRTIGLKLYLSWWNLLDGLILLLSYVGFIFHMYRHATIDDKLQKIIDDPTSYAGFDSLAYWQWQFNVMVAVVVFFVWIKTFKYLNFNHTMTLLSRTLSQCAGDILGYTVMFFIVFLAYAQFGYLVFGPTTFGFHTFGDSIYSLFRIILGDFDFYALIRADRVVGPIFFVTYVFVVFFILINVFLAVINDSYVEVKSDMEDSKYRNEVSAYMGSMFSWAKSKLCRRKVQPEKDTEEGGAGKAGGASAFAAPMAAVKWRNRSSMHRRSANLAAMAQMDEETKARVADMEERITSISQKVDALLVAMENVQIAKAHEMQRNRNAKAADVGVTRRYTTPQEESSNA